MDKDAALEKALRLLNRVLQDRGHTPLKDLAADLALPRSTLYRLTASLVSFGLLARSARGHYDIGLPLLERLGGITPADQLARLSRNRLRRLADSCVATAHLGVLENDMVTYLVKEVGKSAEAGAVFTRENAQLEAYCSGIGKVLLAWLGEAARERYLAAGPFVPFTQRTLASSASLRDCLHQVRRLGQACDDGEAADDLFCLAVPLHRPNGTVDAAISLSFARDPGRGRDFADDLAKLRDCAGELSALLYPPGAAEA